MDVVAVLRLIATWREKGLVLVVDHWIGWRVLGGVEVFVMLVVEGRLFWRQIIVYLV